MPLNEADTRAKLIDPQHSIQQDGQRAAGRAEEFITIRIISTDIKL